MKSLLFALVVMLLPAAAAAQDWSDGRAGPALWEITAVDATGVDGWPYGSEDVAGDGVAFPSAEAQVDVRSVYTAAEADRLWVRTYVVGDQAPANTMVMVVFIDTDNNENTGAAADDPNIFRSFDADPTDGGYEVAVAVQADGTVLDAWDLGNNGRWRTTNLGGNDVDILSGTASDPLGFFGATHGFLQLSLAASVANTDGACDARLFVRVWNDDLNSDIGDDVPDAFACIPVTDNNGNPVVIGTTGCVMDADCPGTDSVCQGGTCLVGFGCSSDNDCLPDQICGAGGTCVTASMGMCTDNADCNGLICDAGMCVACTDTGALACPGDLSCSPSGMCVTAQMPPDAMPDGPEVQGGACVCSTSATSPAPPMWLWVILLSLVVLVVRRKQASTRGAH